MSFSISLKELEEEANEIELPYFPDDHLYFGRNFLRGGLAFSKEKEKVNVGGGAGGSRADGGSFGDSLRVTSLSLRREGNLGELFSSSTSLEAIDRERRVSVSELPGEKESRSSSLQGEAKYKRSSITKSPLPSHGSFTHSYSSRSLHFTTHSLAHNSKGMTPYERTMSTNSLSKVTLNAAEGIKKPERASLSENGTVEEKRRMFERTRRLLLTFYLLVKVVLLLPFLQILTHRLALKRVLKKGYLYQSAQSNIMKKRVWRRRWCVLHEDCILYYKDNTVSSLLYLSTLS